MSISPRQNRCPQYTVTCQLVTVDKSYFMLPSDLRGKLLFFDGVVRRALLSVLAPPFDSGVMWSMSCPFFTGFCFMASRRSLCRLALPEVEPVPLSPRCFCEPYS